MSIQYFQIMLAAQEIAKSCIPRYAWENVLEKYGLFNMINDEYLELERMVKEYSGGKIL